MAHKTAKDIERWEVKEMKKKIVNKKTSVRVTSLEALGGLRFSHARKGFVLDK